MNYEREKFARVDGNCASAFANIKVFGKVLDTMVIKELSVERVELINIAAESWYQSRSKPLVEALNAVKSQCAGHCDEFSRNVWQIANKALEAHNE
jgi:hypothetical protein